MDLPIVQVVKHVFDLNAALDQLLGRGPSASILFVFANHNFQSTFNGLGLRASAESLCAFSILA